MSPAHPLTHSELLQLKRWNTPTIYNGWEQITKRNACADAFNLEVEAFGRKVSPGNLIHADKHGFLVIAPDEAPALLDAAHFMDANECSTVIAAARDTSGRSTEEILSSLSKAATQFSQNVKARFKRESEW